MTATDNLAALAAAVEAGDANGDHFGMVWPPNDRDAWRINCTAWEAFNGDLNAAVRLVEALFPGWGWVVENDSTAAVWHPDTLGVSRDLSTSDTPARALLLAVLRAKMGDGNG